MRASLEVEIDLGHLGYLSRYYEIFVYLLVNIYLLPTVYLLVSYTA
jgi:hypothetical protein